MPSEEARRALIDAYEREWSRVFASTLRTTRDIDLAEEATQDAFTEALAAWTRDGVPRSPGAWLTTTARRRAIDAIRRASSWRTKVHLLVEEETITDGQVRDETPVVADDTLRLIFLCCHPALSSHAQTALTLRLVCGMSTDDIARCFLTSESTMFARLTRAKKKITVARIPFAVPQPSELPARLEGVLGVIYLLFTVGHTAPTGARLVRDDLMSDGVRLARLLRELLPDEREVAGLLALLLVHDARRESRVAVGGHAQRISEQDRSTWDADAIAQARELIECSLRMGRPGRYTLQAAIASLHAEAPTYEAVDWPQIKILYDELLAVWPSPVVQLNRAVALSKTDGPAAALAVVESLETDGRLARYQYLPAVKAYLLEQLGRHDEAETARTAAFRLAANEVERDTLLRDVDGPLARVRGPRD